MAYRKLGRVFVFLRICVAALAVTACRPVSVAGAQATPAPVLDVYLGADMQPRVSLVPKVHGEVVEATYEPGGRLFFVTRSGGDHWVSAWSRTGAPEGEWKLPPGHEPISEFHQVKGSVRILLWLRAKGYHDSLFLAILPAEPKGEVTLEALADWDAYDGSLLPGRVARVHRLMRILGFGPFVGAHADNMKANIETFKVNARELQNHLAWTPDYSALVFSWNSLIVTSAATRKPLGNYRVGSLAAPAEKALGVTLESLVLWDVHAVCVSRGYAGVTAALGVGLRDEKKGGPLARVLWFDLAKSPPKLTAMRDGVLAHPLERY